MGVEKYFPNLYLHESTVAAQWLERTVPMRVLCLGFARTGTTSLQLALQHLGFNPCYHSWNMLSNSHHLALAINMYDFKYHGKGEPFGRKEFDMLMGDCQAVIGTPAAILASELLAAYPDALVILTTRDADTWVKSMQDTVMSPSFCSPLRTLLSYLDPYYHLRAQTGRQGLEFYRAGPRFAEDGPKLMHEHYAFVRERVSKEKLLEWRVEDGWGPLCKFLGVDVPELPFPRVNDKAEFGTGAKTREWRALRLVMLRWILGAAGLLGVGFLLFRAV